MTTLRFSPAWLDDVSSGIDNVELVKKVSELQADFFNWLYKCDVEIASKRLPTTDPVTLFKALMAVELPKDVGSYVYDHILNTVEKPIRDTKAEYLYGVSVDPTTHLKWVFTTEKGKTSFSMGVCEPHASSFTIEEDKKAKLLFMKELFRHLRNTARMVEGSTASGSLFETQPILTALYAAHVTAYNL